MPDYFAVKREIEAFCFSGAILTSLVVIAYLLVPLGIAMPDRTSLLLLVLGIATFFSLSFLEPKPARFVGVRSAGLFLIGAGIGAAILPKISFIRSGLEMAAVTISPERSQAVSTMLVVMGFAVLTTYWMLTYFNRRRNSANNPMRGSGEVGGTEVEDLSSPPRDR